MVLTILLWANSAFTMPGFFDPGFGYGADDIKGHACGARGAVARSTVSARDGQVVGRLVFERLLGPPSKVYGQGIGSSYQHQRLSLSNILRGRVDDA